jgi:hypothetical protein
MDGSMRYMRRMLEDLTFVLMGYGLHIPYEWYAAIPDDTHGRVSDRADGVHDRAGRGGSHSPEEVR